MDRSERIVAVALQLATQTRTEGISLRLFGSCAVYLKCTGGSDILEINQREVKDIDAVVLRQCLPKLRQVLRKNGWHEEIELTGLSDGQRLRFLGEGGTVLDVTVDQLRFCQTLRLENRLSLDWPTIPITDLLLSKLQISDVARNDFVDMASLLNSFEVTPSSESEISLARISQQCSASWRWYHATTLACARLIKISAHDVRLSPSQQALIEERAYKISTAIKFVSKSFTWKIRSLLGEFVPWQSPVESVN